MSSVKTAFYFLCLLGSPPGAQAGINLSGITMLPFTGVSDLLGKFILQMLTEMITRSKTRMASPVAPTSNSVSHTTVKVSGTGFQTH